jgi:hypothetical protein
VPSLHEDTVSVKEVPDDALIAKEHPVAVPEFEKSLFATVVTFCEVENVKSIGEVVEVGVLSDETKFEMLGALSYVIFTKPFPDLPVIVPPDGLGIVALPAVKVVEVSVPV